MFRPVAMAVVLCLVSVTAGAGLFDDDEARKAILDLRQRVELVRLSVETLRLSVETLRLDSDKGVNRADEDGALLRRSLLELQNQIETMRSEMAKLRGLNEQLSRDLADVQRRQIDMAQGVDDRMRQLEPVKVALDGREFKAGF